MLSYNLNEELNYSEPELYYKPKPKLIITKKEEIELPNEIKQNILSFIFFKNEEEKIEHVRKTVENIWITRDKIVNEIREILNDRLHFDKIKYNFLEGEQQKLVSKYFKIVSKYEDNEKYRKAVFQKR